jgi:hypothetical protein
MKHIFQLNPSGDYLRLTDRARGNLRSYGDSINAHGALLVDPTQFKPWVELPVDPLLAAHARAAELFASLTPGKQALWEPVRVAVEKAILAGDMPTAYGILATMPIIYEGAVADRAMFLALFASNE